MTRRLPSVNITPGPEGAIMTTANHRPSWSGGGAQMAPEPYYRPGDGDNWGLAIQRAIDALAAFGGGTILLGASEYGWRGVIKIRDSIWLEGVSHGDFATIGLKALDNTARLQLGDWDTDTRPGGIAKLKVEGDSTGDTAGLVYVEGVAAAMHHVSIWNAAGVGLYLNASQNMHFDSVDVGVCGTGIKLDNGAGGNLFSRCEIVSNQTGVHFYDDAGMANAYPFGPAHNTFLHCIVEIYEACDYLILAEAGANNTFIDCGISVNDVDLTSGSQVVINNSLYPGISTYAHFHGCNFNGGLDVSRRYTTIEIVGNNYCFITGSTFIQQSNDVFVQNSGTGVLSIDGQLFYGINVGTKFATTGGGSTVSWGVTRELGMNFVIDSATPTAFLAAKRAGDTGGRFFITRDGGIGWQNGTDFTIRQSIGYDGTNDRIEATATRFSQGFARKPATTLTPTAGSALSLDSKASSTYKILLIGTGSVASMTVTNPLDGQRLTIWLAATAGQAFAWATNMRFDGGGAGPASPAAGNWLKIEFEYDAVTSLWHEMFRSTTLTT